MNRLLLGMEGLAVPCQGRGVPLLWFVMPAYRTGLSFVGAVAAMLGGSLSCGGFRLDEGLRSLLVVDGEGRVPLGSASPRVIDFGRPPGHHAGLEPMHSALEAGLLEAPDPVVHDLEEARRRSEAFDACRREDHWLPGFRWARRLGIGPRDLDAKLALFGIDPAHSLYLKALRDLGSSTQRVGTSKPGA